MLSLLVVPQQGQESADSAETLALLRPQQRKVTDPVLQHYLL